MAGSSTVRGFVAYEEGALIAMLKTIAQNKRWIGTGEADDLAYYKT